MQCHARQSNPGDNSTISCVMAIFKSAGQRVAILAIWLYNVGQGGYVGSLSDGQREIRAASGKGS